MWNGEPDASGARRWGALVAMLVALAPGRAPAQIRINEIDYDQGDVDTLELVELTNVGTEPQSLLDWDLKIGPIGGINLPPVTIEPGGYFVVCGLKGLPSPCNVRLPRRNNLPDGPDGELRVTDAQGQVVDAVVYESATLDVADPGGAAPGIGIARCPDGRQSGPGRVDFVPAPITPGAPNACDDLAPLAVSDAGTVGDQLLYFYDARAGRVTFLTIGNPNPTPAPVEIAFYAQGLDVRLGETTATIAAGGAQVIDPTTIAGVPGHAGLATATPIAGAGDHTPRVLARPLVGGYTLANLQLGAGFGENPFGRLALAVGGGGRDDFARAFDGATVDGARVQYQQIQPPATAPSLVVPAYFDPETLAPVELDGTRMLLASFRDEYAAPAGPGGSARFTLAPAARPVGVRMLDQLGGVVADGALAVSGVHLGTLQGLAGGASLSSPGRAELTMLTPLAARESVLGLFTQALGTFAIGQRLPSLAAREGARLDAPLSVGDQLLYLYDARADRTTFLTVGNPNAEAVVVEIVFYRDDLARLAEEVRTIPPGGAGVVDSTAAAFAGVAGSVGLATVTPIASSVDHTPVLHARPLTGGFSIVNLALGAGFGENPLGRLAVGGGGESLGTRPAPAPGATAAVDGASVVYQTITPPAAASSADAPTLAVPVYFDPQRLSPEAQDGNRFFLVSFRDQYAAPVGPGGAPRVHLVAATQTAAYELRDRDGELVAFGDWIGIHGVELGTLGGLAGVALDGPGRVELRMTPEAGSSVFGLFSQALGTFAIGQRLPSLAAE